MHKFSARKKIVAAAVVAAVLGGTGMAVAYWTGSGSGSGSGSAASSADGAVSLVGSYDASSLVPGGSSAVTIKASSTSHSDVQIGTITAGTPTVDATSAAAGCLASWFHVTSSISGSNTVLHGATNQTLTGRTASITMDNAVDGSGNPVDQNACKGATVSFSLS